jgi:hypothetical protein
VAGPRRRRGFPVVVSVSFSLAAIATLDFAISIRTLAVSAGIAVFDRRYVPSPVAAVVVPAISAWTIVASLIFSQSTVRNLALAESLRNRRTTWPGAAQHGQLSTTTQQV